ncbi:excisionase family DNA-binding protein [Agromyces sp. Q22]|uniref:Excisionase family DNA-binding protein n=2 Tax=Agromyces kandeliae TaxID=2666141 RepID=A0A6L5R6X8_9MICO|nr:excisionase family DNA-binding protein [Agromyces kandeliae]
MTSEARWGSMQEAAELARVSTRTIRRRIADGVLPARRFGPRLIRVDLNQLDEMGRPLPGRRVS